MLAETRRLLAEHPAVSAAFVFGSWAPEGARAGRDVDVALLPDGRLSHAAAFSLALEVGERLEHALGGKVDVVLLPHAAPGVAFRALRGILVVDRDPVARAAWTQDARASRSRYLGDEDLQAQVERRLQLAAQIAIDLANYFIARRGLEIPDVEEHVFVILGRAGIIDAALAQRQKGLVRFRNILVHDYLSVDPGLVYEHLSQRIEDFGAFARQVAAYVEREAGSGGRD